ncbi:MAG: transporter [Gammaproteobacteria bacterium]
MTLRVATSLSIASLLAAPPLCAQQLTPRIFWPAPRGTEIIVAGYAHSAGDVVVDPSLPLTGVDSRIHTGVVAYQQTIALAGRTANVQFELPYVDGSVSGMVGGVAIGRDVSGIGDFAATLSVNLMGAPSMTAAEFQALRASPRPVLGGSIKLVAPTGRYDPDRLVNIGTNRWAARVQVGYIRPLSDRWLTELTLGTWFFEDNTEFLGETREQEPIAAFNVHLVRRLAPGFWTSLDFNYYAGGRTTISGSESADFQRNSRVGFTVAYPVNNRHLLKASYSLGAVTQSGGDYDKLDISYVYRIN